MRCLPSSLGGRYVRWRESLMLLLSIMLAMCIVMVFPIRPASGLLIIAISVVLEMMLALYLSGLARNVPQHTKESAQPARSADMRLCLPDDPALKKWTEICTN